jgi:hypothetical protein
MRPTAREQADFDRDGAVLMRDVVPAGWRSVLADAIERDIAAPGPYFVGYRPQLGRFHGNQRIWENDEGFRSFCCEGPLRALAARLLGSERLNLFYDQLFIKEPGTPQRTRWHNDQPYWPVRGWPVMSFWLPLDPVTSAEAFRAAVADGVKLVFLSNLPSGYVHGVDYAAIVTDDLFQMGKQAADALAEAMGGSGTVGWIFHDAAYYVTNQRDNAFKTTIENDYPDISIVAEQGISDPARAEEIANAMLLRHPDLGGVYVTWAGPARRPRRRRSPRRCRPAPCRARSARSDRG